MKTSREKMQRRAQRVRTKLRKVAEGLPRLSVSRSHKNISVQIIDDEKGITLASASTLEAEVLAGAKAGSNIRSTQPWLAKPLPSAPRRPALKTLSSTAAVTCSTAG